MMNLQSVIKVGLVSGLLSFSTLAFSQATQNTNKTANTTKSTAQPNDASITHTVKKSIAQSKTLSKLKVNVSTHDGVVTLDGNVDSDTQAELLIETAESIQGVSDVDASKLTVKDGQQPLADTVITAKIKGLFIREELFGEKDISGINTTVETKDGVVYLSGGVENKQEIDNAIAIIKKSIPEVHKVEYNVVKNNTAN